MPLFKQIIYNPLSLHRQSRRFGFTLIELLVVITIIGILIAIATVSYVNSQQKGNDGKRKSDLKAVQQALELYFQQNGKYPAGSSGSIQCNITGDSTTKTWGTSPFTCGSITYLNLLPKDSKYQSTNGYYYSSSGSPPNSYVISADLENNSDPERSTGSSPSCTTPQSGRDYCVKNP